MWLCKLVSEVVGGRRKVAEIWLRSQVPRNGWEKASGINCQDGIAVRGLVPRLPIVSTQPNLGKMSQSFGTCYVAGNKMFPSLAKEISNGWFAFCNTGHVAILSNVSTRSYSKISLELSGGTCGSIEDLGQNMCKKTTSFPRAIIRRPVSQPITHLRAAFNSSILSPPNLHLMDGLTHIPPPYMESTRSVIKFSLRKGRRKTVGVIKNRFYRLDWGGWISAIPGRSRHLWKKPPYHREFLKNHVLRNGKEVNLLEKFCTKYWIKKKYFVDDPYESYHTRDSFKITKGVCGITSTTLHQPPRLALRQSKHRKS